MSSHFLDGFALVDFTGRLILAMIGTALVLSVVLNLRARARYASLEADLAENGAGRRRFSHSVLNAILERARNSVGPGGESNTQAIIESQFQSELGGLLLAERFIRAASGLVIILGLMGTFYGLTLSIGKLVQLVGGDTGSVGDVTQAVTTGLTQALSGMAVAFSNSLVGIFSAVILTVFGVFSNVTDRRVALMLHVETYLDRLLAEADETGSTVSPANGRGALAGPVKAFGDSVERLDTVVARFESALNAFSSSTREFNEFNAHLKDNVQRMSLSFGDFSDELKSHALSLKSQNGK